MTSARMSQRCILSIVFGGAPFPVTNSCIDGQDRGLILAYLLKGGVRGER